MLPPSSEKTIGLVRRAGLRRTILPALVFAGGEIASRNVVDFCTANLGRFSAAISKQSAEILAITSPIALYQLGWKFSGISVYLPKSRYRSFAKTTIAEAIGAAHAAAVCEEFGEGTFLSLPNIISEFHDFYCRGFILFHHSRGMSLPSVALAAGVTERNIYQIVADERRNRLKLNLEPTAATFMVYWDVIFPPADDRADLRAAEGNSPPSATIPAADLLNAKLNAPTASEGHAE